MHLGSAAYPHERLFAPLYVVRSVGRAPRHPASFDAAVDNDVGFNANRLKVAFLRPSIRAYGVSDAAHRQL